MQPQDPLKAKLQSQKQQFQKQADQEKLQIAQQVAKKKLDILKAKGQKQLQQEDRLTERETDKHPVEYYDAKEREAKAKWHYSRVGKNKNASFRKGIENDYKSQLLKKGVIDSEGKQKSFREEIDEGEAVSDEKFGRSNYWYRQHLNKYHIYLRNGDLSKAEVHRKKAVEYKRRSYIALDNPEKHFQR